VDYEMKNEEKIIRLEEVISTLIRLIAKTQVELSQRKEEISSIQKELVSLKYAVARIEENQTALLHKLESLTQNPESSRHLRSKHMILQPRQPH
jgi:chromosome segregation ATPase